MQQFAVLALLVGLAGIAPAGEPAPLELDELRHDGGRPARAERVDASPVGPDEGELDARWPNPEVRVTYNTATDYADWENQRNIVVDGGGAIHAVWYNMGSFYQVIYKRSTDGGATWTDSTAVSAVAPYNGHYNRYPSMALDSTGNVHIVWSSAGASGANRRILHRERSAAGAWSAVTVLVDSASNYWRTNPSVACSPDGRVHAAWQTRAYIAAVNYFCITTRERVTSTWQTPVDHSYGTFQTYYPAIALDRANNVHVAWRGEQTGLYQVMYRKRTGPTWGTVIDVTQANASQLYAVPSIAVDSVTPFIVFKAGTANYRIVLARDSLGTWLRDTLTPSGWSRYCYAPQVAPGLNGWMHVAYQGYSDAAPSYQQVRYGTWTRTDRWTGFEDATAVNNTGRYCPSVFADAAGDIHLLWHDNRDGNYEIYYKRGLPPFANDVAVSSVNNVWPFVARSATVSVGVTVRNEGTTARPAGLPVYLAITGPLGYSYNDTVLTTVSLTKGQSQSLTFSPNWAAPANKGAYRLSVRTGLTGDQNPSNDTLGRDVYVYPGLYETWSGTAFPPTGWDTLRLSGTGSPQWQRTTTAPYYSTTPGAAQFRSYLIPIGNVAALRSPRLDLTLESSDSLIFYHLHLPYTGAANDSLEVQASTDLGISWATLATYTGIDTPWSRKALSLEGVGQTDQCFVRFVGRSRYNHYLNVDDVMAPALYAPLSDLAMVGTYNVPSYPLVSNSAETVAVTVRNLGRASSSPCNVHVQVNGSAAGSAPLRALAPNEALLVGIPITPTGSGERASFRFWHDLAGDEVRSNDTIATLSDWIFPVGTWQALGFDWNVTTWPPTGWDTLNNDGGSYCWNRYNSAGYANSGRYYGGSYYENAMLRNDDWLVSPAFQPLGGVTDSFGLYYRAYSSSYPESLEIWLMRGQTIADTIARLCAASATSQTYGGLSVGLDAWDDSTVHIGIRNRSLDMYYLLVDDIWWRRSLAAPPPPALALPPDGAGNQPTNGLLTWRSTPDADAYDVYLDTLYPPVTQVADSIADTTCAYSGLLPLRSYYWAVFARNGAGRTGSPMWEFRTTGTVPMTPGWHEVRPGVPTTPSGKAAKDGGWLAWDEGTARIYVMKGFKTGDFYAYDPLDSSWTGLAAMPPGVENKLPYKGAIGATDGNGTVYATKGNNTPGFWRYSAFDSSWTQLADVPLGLSNKKVKGGTDLVYVAGDSDYVYLLKGYKCEFFRYNVTSGRWQALADAPAGTRPKWDKGSWLVCDGAATLYAHKAKMHEFYTYSLSTGAWSTALTGMPLFNSRTGKQKKAKDGSDAVLFGGSIYALKGGNTQDFYRFEVATGAWTECETLPAFGSTGKKKRVKAGGAITATGDWEAPLFALKGNKTVELWRYAIGTPLAAAPARSGVMAEKTARAASLSLGPNPLASGVATLRYSLPVPGPVRVTVFDVTGRAVAGRSLALGRAGTVSVDLRELAAGVYLVKLSSDGFTGTQKLVVER
ncbi:MAG: T9SS type A sorting domain-containing protein [bacterium]